MTYDLMHRPAYDPNAVLTPVAVAQDYNNALLNAVIYADERGLSMVPLNPLFIPSLKGCTQGQTVLGTSEEKSEDAPITKV
jgi:hypothetical protein